MEETIETDYEIRKYDKDLFEHSRARSKAPCVYAIPRSFVTGVRPVAPFAVRIGDPENYCSRGRRLKMNSKPRGSIT